MRSFFWQLCAALDFLSCAAFRRGERAFHASYFWALSKLLLGLGAAGFETGWVATRGYGLGRSVLGWTNQRAHRAMRRAFRHLDRSVALEPRQVP